jgi:enoyl-CoA hydratase/carnithine racemase
MAFATIQEQQVEAEHILAEQRGAVLWLCLNKPKQRNPLSLAMIKVLHEAIDNAGSDPKVRAVVIHSTGPVFCAGHDLREMAEVPPGGIENRERHLRNIFHNCAAMMQAIVHSPKAIIASVQGTATAAGCQLVSACDLALASEGAHFCTPGVNIGNFCTTPLVGIGRNMHRKHAMELALTGDMFTADDAVRMGLINRAVPGTDLEHEVTLLADKVASKSAQGIRAGKSAFYRQIELSLPEAFDYATEEMIKGTLSQDSTEGTAAFFGKREPQWGDA